jgi:nucleoside-diphosphate-sugar epimerase
LADRLVLVTGGAGLIGSYLVDLLLDDGWRVRILDNLEPQMHPCLPCGNAVVMSVIRVA